MAVNLIDSTDIIITQTGQNIQLETSVDMQDVKTQSQTNATDINNLKSGEVYSTTEVKTNKVWINNKPIYRKVISGTLPTISGSGSIDTNLAHSISNFDEFTEVHGYLIQKSTGKKYNFPILSSSGRLTSLYQVDNTNVVVRSYNESWTANNWNYEITIEYTKTTD